MTAADDAWATGAAREWALACCAVDAVLDSILLLDASREAVVATADDLIDLVRALPDATQVRRFVLGSTESEDDLWTSVQGVADGGLVPTFGPLVRRPEESALVVVVPDLARLSLAGARAATMMIGSARTILEREGQSHRWTTRTYWVTACASSDTGRVSPHLLDRIAVRVPRRAGEPVDRAADILRALSDSRDDRAHRRQLSAEQALAGRRLVPPLLADDAAAIADELAPGTSLRRPLALLRLAAATARLSGESTVTPAHVRTAAVLTGVLAEPPPSAPSASTATAPDASPARPDRPPSDAASPTDEPPVDPPAPEPACDAPEHAATAAVPTPTAWRAPEAGAAPVDAFAVATAAARTLAAAATPVCDPYPEDSVEPLREFSPLARPAPRGVPAVGGRGVVIGSAPARSLHDIAWVATLRRAAVYQRFRRREGEQGRGIRIAATDLRAHRRLPEPGGLLVLVLDHTCRHGWNWIPSLAPYLSHAYEARHAVTVVDVGSADATSPLRAERTVLRSALDPRLLDALDRRAGTATPLAHGLTLAHLTAEHALRRGPSAVRSVQVVVATDGLGNVPLDASLTDTVPSGVRREGVDDALEAATALRELDRVRCVTVEPRAPGHPEIFHELVAALSDDRAMVPA